MEEYFKFANLEHKVSEGKKLELRLGPPGELLGSIDAGTRIVDQNHNNSNDKQCNEPSGAAPLKRAAAATLVGWPPIRAFWKNLSNSKQQTNQSQKNKTPTAQEGSTENRSSNDLYVKINMEGVPIGRKINLNAYDSYHKLSLAIHDLFRDLLAAQKGSYGDMNVKKDEEKSKSKGESGEYTLVYEDSEGDMILVGDIPWSMFVSTAKRMRVLKSSGLSMPRREQDMTQLDGR